METVRPSTRRPSAAAQDEASTHALPRVAQDEEVLRATTIPLILSRDPKGRESKDARRLALLPEAPGALVDVVEHHLGQHLGARDEGAPAETARDQERDHEGVEGREYPPAHRLHHRPAPGDVGRSPQSRHGALLKERCSRRILSENGPARSHPSWSSWPDLFRPSTCSSEAKEHVDARDKHGHDDPCRG